MIQHSPVLEAETFKDFEFAVSVTLVSQGVVLQLSKSSLLNHPPAGESQFLRSLHSPAFPGVGYSRKRVL